MAQPEKQYVCCPYCRNDDPKLLFEPQQLRDGRTGGVVRCKKCRLIYRNLLTCEENNRRHYEKEYYPQKPSANWAASRKQLFQYYLEWLEPYRQSGRVLDVGAGHGFFLDLCAKQNWSCEGVELSEQCVDYAAREYGLRLFRGTVEQAQYPDDHFDVVTLWNVLDQVPDPSGLLKELYRILRPQGGLFIRVPNASFHVLCRRLFNGLGGVVSKIRSLDPSAFQHLTYDRRTVQHFLRKAGFQRTVVLHSRLCWTNTRTDRPGYLRETISALMSGFAQGILTMSLGLWMVGPSLFITARKPARQSEASK